jgi:hypothetical protein
MVLAGVVLAPRREFVLACWLGRRGGHSGHSIRLGRSSPAQNGVRQTASRGRGGRLGNVTGRVRRNAAVIAAASIIGALGIGGVVTANADNGSGGSGQNTTEKSDGDGEVPDAQENDANEANELGETADDEADGETNDDATDTGPDANPNEPGHQDAGDAK